MEKGIEKIFKAIVEGIVDIGNNYIFGPFAPLSDKMVGLVKESFENGPTSYNLAVEECEKYIPENFKKYTPIIVTAVELCIEQLDLIESYNYEENNCIENITKQYIERYCKQFGEDELGALRNFLDIIIKKTLESLHLAKENDPEFRIKFKQEVSKKLKTVDITLSEQSSDIHEMKERLENDRSKTSLVNECHGKYRKDWNKPMFLTENINLCDLHMLPYYEDKRGEQHKDLEERLREVLDSNEDKRWENKIKQKLHSRTVLDLNEVKRNYMLLILGHPGYGKTTLMTYVMNHYSDELDGRKVRMYCFRSFENINWNSKPENLFGEMLKHMDLKIKDLNNSVLILDGLDEINMGDNQIQFLNCICEDWVESKEISDFILFVTCRTNRISDKSRLVCPYIQLCPLQESQIKSFVKKYNTFDLRSVNRKKSIGRLLESNEELKEVLGIPLVLYMILALHIKLRKESNLVEVYNKIFSIDDPDSIYRRTNYEHGAKHPITDEEAVYIHQFSKQIALDMWENNPEKAVVNQEGYEKIYDKIYEEIVEQVKAEKNVRDLLIGQYFMEGKDSGELYFVHRSMYQYFVALSIFDSIQYMIKKGSPSDQFEELQNKFLNQEDSDQKQSDITLFAELIGKKLIYSDSDIGQYLFSMLKSLTGEGTQWLEEFLICFFDNGLSRYIDDYKESSLRCFDKEIVRFYNLIWLIRERLRGIDSSQLYYKVAKVDAKFYFFLRGKNVNYVDLSKIDLEGAHLEGVHLFGVNLTGTNLEGARLEGAYLEEARLEGAHLEGAHLEGAHLTGANLTGTNLEGARLEGAYLEEARLEGAHLEGAHLEGAHLTGAHLTGVHLTGAHLPEVHLEGVNLEGAHLEGAHLEGAHLEGVNLKGAHLEGAHLEGAHLVNAKLKGAHLEEAHLEEVHLTGANLTRAVLKHTIVDKEKLREVILDEKNYMKFFGDEFK